MSETLVRIDAPHFCAGIIIADDRCIKAAPILAWSIGRNAAYLRKYFADKGWKATVLLNKE